MRKGGSSFSLSGRGSFSQAASEGGVRRTSSFGRIKSFKPFRSFGRSRGASKEADAAPDCVPEDAALSAEEAALPTSVPEGLPPLAGSPPSLFHLRTSALEQLVAEGKVDGDAPFHAVRASLGRQTLSYLDDEQEEDSDVPSEVEERERAARTGGAPDSGVFLPQHGADAGERPRGRALASLTSMSPPPA